jgi:hypothetical protein
MDVIDLHRGPFDFSGPVAGGGIDRNHEILSVNCDGRGCHRQQRQTKHGREKCGSDGKTGRGFHINREVVEIT